VKYWTNVSLNFVVTEFCRLETTNPNACEAGCTRKARGAASKMQTPGQQREFSEPAKRANDSALDRIAMMLVNHVRDGRPLCGLASLYEPTWGSLRSPQALRVPPALQALGKNKSQCAVWKY